MRTGSRSARLSYSASSAPDVTIAVSGEEGPGLRKLGSLNSVARLVDRGDCSWADRSSATADDRPSRAPSAQRQRAGSRSVDRESGRLRTRGGTRFSPNPGAAARRAVPVRYLCRVHRVACGSLSPLRRSPSRLRGRMHKRRARCRQPAWPRCSHAIGTVTTIAPIACWGASPRRTS